MLIDVTILDAWCQELADAIDAGAGPGVARFYDMIPNPPDNDQVLLIEYEMPDPCGTVSGGALTIGTVANATGLVGGDAFWCQMCDSDGNVVLEGQCGVGSDYDFPVLNVTVGAGQPGMWTAAVFDFYGFL